MVKDCVGGCLGAVCTFCICGMLGGIIFGLLYAPTYVQNKDAQSVFKPTNCFVIRRESSESCSMYSGDSCTTGWIYFVQYNISDGRTLESKMNNHPAMMQTVGDLLFKRIDFLSNIFQGNQTYKCFYDFTDVESVRWDWPDKNSYEVRIYATWIGFSVSSLMGVCWCYSIFKYLIVVSS